MNARTPTLVALYDASSAHWRGEIARFELARALLAGDQSYVLKLIDIRGPLFHASAYGLGEDMLEDALYVRDERGLWHSGFAALRCLYQHVESGKTTTFAKSLNVRRVSEKNSQVPMRKRLAGARQFR
jgi:hypothetical protein